MPEQTRIIPRVGYMDTDSIYVTGSNSIAIGSQNTTTARAWTIPELYHSLYTPHLTKKHDLKTIKKEGYKQ